jgi:hypothetical protein
MPLQNGQERTRLCNKFTRYSTEGLPHGRQAVTDSRAHATLPVVQAAAQWGRATAAALQGGQAALLHD